ncbi:hypothetical protein O181_014646 [Austropuccinia psidii MF-1]|uniref:Pre-rRNA-processing protein IPI3 n=1 Tax=Austropuccinia psidii MF-1 TaxID=1389203 RepID=A0A9Q3BYH6_9BASI|nr:hypothetical protein [Austropuccinia psidii MF-1]
MASTDSIVFSVRPSSEGCQTLAFHELSTSSLLHQLKPPPNSAFLSSTNSLPPRKTAVCLPSIDALGSTIVSVSGKDGRAGLMVWSCLNGKPAPSHKLVPPGRMVVVALSGSGAYLATGSADGTVMLWEFSTGTLLATFDAHYKALTCLEFSQDEAALVTASEDSLCSVWSISTLIDESMDSSLSHTPYSIFSDHALPISDLHISAGCFPDIRVFTASLDKTIKIWSPLYPASPLLSTFAIPGPAHYLAVDPLERFILVSYASPNKDGSANAQPIQSDPKQAINHFDSSALPNPSSTIRIIPLFSRPTHAARQGGVSLTHASTGFVHQNGCNSDETTYTSPPGTPITALHLPSHITSNFILLCGLANGKIVHLSIPSLQPLGQTNPPTSTANGIDPVVYISTFPRPPDLLRSYSGVRQISDTAAGSVTSNHILIPARPVGALGRIVGRSGDALRVPDSTSDSNHRKHCQNLTTMLKIGLSPIHDLNLTESDPFSLPSDFLWYPRCVPSSGLRDKILGPPTNIVDKPTTQLHTDDSEIKTDLIDKLTAESASLKEQLVQALSFNDAMWNGIVDGTLKFKPPPQPDTAL